MVDGEKFFMGSNMRQEWHVFTYLLVTLNVGTLFRLSARLFECPEPCSSTLHTSEPTFCSSPFDIAGLFALLSLHHSMSWTTVLHV